MIRYSILNIAGLRVFVAATQQGICRVKFLNENEILQSLIERTSFIKDDMYFFKLKKEVEEYFSRERRVFTWKLDLAQGSEFQRKVWNALLKIPYGETRSYQEVAEMCGTPGGARAVGMACRRNPIPLLIPCHRVIRKDRTLGGYGGMNPYGLKIKRYLLMIEGVEGLK